LSHTLPHKVYVSLYAIIKEEVSQYLGTTDTSPTDHPTTSHDTQFRTPSASAQA